MSKYRTNYYSIQKIYQELGEENIKADNPEVIEAYARVRVTETGMNEEQTCTDAISSNAI